MADLFVSLVTINPKLAVSTSSVPTPSTPLGQDGGNGFGGIFNELGQRQVQTPGSK